MAFTTLAHDSDLAWMLEAYRQTRKDGAVGVDGPPLVARGHWLDLERE